MNNQLLIRITFSPTTDIDKNLVAATLAGLAEQLVIGDLEVDQLTSSLDDELFEVRDKTSRLIDLLDRDTPQWKQALDIRNDLSRMLEEQT